MTHRWFDGVRLALAHVPSVSVGMPADGSALNPVVALLLVVGLLAAWGLAGVVAAWQARRACRRGALEHRAPGSGRIGSSDTGCCRPCTAG